MEAIHIVGAGGIGCAVGFALARAGATVVVVENSPDRLDWCREHGLRVDSAPAAHVPAVAFADWQPPAGTVVLLCTKCYDNAAVLARVPAQVPVVPIQNGFDPDLASLPGHVEGIASFVSEAYPGRTHTRITRAGRLHLGPAGKGQARAPDLQLLAQLLRRAPFRVRLVEDIRPYKHTKLMYNAALCPLAAAGGLDNGDVLRLPHVRDLFFTLLRENHAILTRAGLPLGQVGPLAPATVARILARPWLARLLAVPLAHTLRGTYCSMTADLPAGRTEVDNYNGYLIELAGDFPCPLNRLVLGLVRRMVEHRLPPGRERLEELEMRIAG
jgi:2-dehydropantoate 2-reductase